MWNWDANALVGAFSVIVKTECETDGDGSYAAYFIVAAGRQEVSFICYMKFIFYAYTKKSFFTSHESDSEPTTAEGNLDFTLF